VNAPGAAVAAAAARRFNLRRLAFTWQARAEGPGLHVAAVLAAAERHLQSHHARVEREADGQALRFGSGSGARRNWLGATRGGRLQVRMADGYIEVTVVAVVARTLLICALPAVLISALGAWPLALLFAFAAAANLWWVDQGARRLLVAALEP
jgi:hypothetical protein